MNIRNRIREILPQLTATSEALYGLNVGRLDISFQFNSRFKRVLGRANCDAVYHGALDALIEFSPDWWASLGEDEKIELVDHEVCHIVQYRILYLDRIQGRGDLDTKPHGRVWKRLMRSLGHEPTARHRGPRPKSVKRSRHDGWRDCECACGKCKEIGPRRAKKIIARQRTYYCKSCGSRIRLV